MTQDAEKNTTTSDIPLCTSLHYIMKQRYQFFPKYHSNIIFSLHHFPVCTCLEVIGMTCSQYLDMSTRWVFPRLEVQATPVAKKPQVTCDGSRLRDLNVEDPGLWYIYMGWARGYRAIGLWVFNIFHACKSFDGRYIGPFNLSIGRLSDGHPFGGPGRPGWLRRERRSGGLQTARGQRSSERRFGSSRRASQLMPMQTLDSSIPPYEDASQSWGAPSETTNPPKKLGHTKLREHHLAESELAISWS